MHFSETACDEGLYVIYSNEEVSDNEEYGDGVGYLEEDYFTAHSRKSVKTSNHTLTKLAKPTMNIKTVKSLTAVASFKEERVALVEEYQSRFQYWLLQISNGFNILLCGVGSKKDLLEKFRVQVLSKSCHLVVKGYFPGLTIKQVLTQISEEMLDHSGSFKSDQEHALFIKRTLEVRKSDASKAGKSPQEIFLVIHNIDGVSLRNDNSQNCLSILAQSPSIYILASIDHINATLLWDQTKLSHFRWVWHDTTTYEPYIDEVSYENSLLVQRSETVGLSSLNHIIEALTPNACGIFNLLAKNQLEKSSLDGVYLGMSFNDCYRKCREKFFVNNDVALRTQLIEFRDHKLIKSCNGPDGTEYLVISVDNGVLTQFMEQHGSKD